jgi:hypothetical protein
MRCIIDVKIPPRLGKSRLATPALVATCLLSISTNTSAQIILEEATQQSDRYMVAESKVTNVKQLQDLSPTDWAYKALPSFGDRYGCILGFPDLTYRGNQTLSRYEFAAGLNSCLNPIEDLIISSQTVLQKDIATILFCHESVYFSSIRLKTCFHFP